MQLAYIDETKQSGRRRGLGTLLGLGSICFGQDDVKTFAEAFRAVLDDHSVPRDVELKWSSEGKSDWFRLNGKQEEVTPIRSELLACARNHGARVHVVVWDTSAAPDCEGVAPMDKARVFLVERFIFLLRDLDDRGMLLFDEPGGGPRAKARWERAALDLTENGSEFVAADRIVGPPVALDSRLHPQMQMADLIVGAVTAAMSGSKFGLDLMPLIRPMFYTNRYGTIGAAGLKLFPDHLNNLHYWVNEETDFFGHYGRITLPSARWQFSGNCGLSV